MDLVTRQSENFAEMGQGGEPPAYEPRKVAGLRAIALVEMIIFFAGVLLVDTLWGGGDRFYGVEPHPFWAIILLMSMQYGVLTGLLAAVASILAYLIGNDAINLSETLPPEVYLHPALWNPVLWIAAAIILGGIRQRHIREKNKLESKLREAINREAITARAYADVRDRKQRMEERVAGEMRSALTVYQAAKSLETMSPSHLLRAIEQIIGDLLGAKVFSLFLLENNTLNATLTSGWNSNGYAQLPRRYSASSTLYQQLIGKRQVLTAANVEHERVLAGEGVLAAPIITTTGEVLGMIKVESLPFSRFGIHTVETLRGIAQWVAAAMTNARSYESALGQAVEDPQTQLMTSSYFERYTQFVTALGKRAKFPVSMVGVGMSLPADLPEGEQLRVNRAIAEAVRESLRSIDFAFDYTQGSAQYSIVLPTTPRSGAEIVRDKVTQSLERILKAQNIRYPFSTTVQELAA